MSKNHQYLQKANQVYKKYKKTVPSAVTGKRVNPLDLNQQIDFILTSAPDSYDVEWVDGQNPKLVHKGFDYDTEVIEVYSEAEYKMFLRMNANLIQNGILVEYSEDSPQPELSNALSDEQVEEIASIKQLLSLRKRLEDIDSIHTLNRIKDAANKLNRTVKVIQAIDDRINDITE